MVVTCRLAGDGWLGAHAADIVLSRLAGTGPTVINQALLGSCISLGRRGGARQLARKDHTPLSIYLSGRLAVAYRGS